MALEKLKCDKMVTERAVRVALDLLSHDKSAEFQYENAVCQVMTNEYSIKQQYIIQQYYTAMLCLLY